MNRHANSHPHASRHPHLLPANRHSNGPIENGYPNGNASSDEDSDSSSSNDGDSDTDHSEDDDYDTNVDILGVSDDKDPGGGAVEDDELEEDIKRIVLNLLEINTDNEAEDIGGDGESTELHGHERVRQWSSARQPPSPLAARQPTF
nr:uncharacterized protein LOC112770374 [Arachis hypogaea]